MLGIIASNFLKIGNGWTIVEKYATTAVYVLIHFFPSPRKNTHQLNGKEIDDSTENMFDITYGH